MFFPIVYVSWLILHVNSAEPWVPRYLVKHYSGCVCEGFPMRLMFKSLDQVKQIAFPNMCGPEQNKVLPSPIQEGIPCACLCPGLQLSPVFGFKWKLSGACCPSE